jgi:hypothetical protein
MFSRTVTFSKFNLFARHANKSLTFLSKSQLLSERKEEYAERVDSREAKSNKPNREHIKNEPINPKYRNPIYKQKHQQNASLKKENNVLLSLHSSFIE